MKTALTIPAFVSFGLAVFVGAQLLSTGAYLLAAGIFVTVVFACYGWVCWCQPA